MKIINVMVLGLFASALTLLGCQPANAMDFSLGYQDNQVIDKEGVVASAGGEYNNLRYGVTTFATTDKLESYGVYGKMPIYIQGTNFAVTPQIQVDRYRDIKETVGSVGLGGEYAFTKTLRLEAIGMVSKGFDNSDVRGETYTIGLTKAF